MGDYEGSSSTTNHGPAFDHIGQRGSFRGRFDPQDGRRVENQSTTSRESRRWCSATDCRGSVGTPAIPCYDLLRQSDKWHSTSSTSLRPSIEDAISTPQGKGGTLPQQPFWKARQLLCSNGHQPRPEPRYQ